MMQTSPIRIGNLPVGLICTETGELAFIRMADFPPIYDLAPTPYGPDAIFDNTGFCIGEGNYDYGVLIPYKDIPEMLNWLQRQQLINPFKENE